MVARERILPLNELPVVSGPVIYWMSRDQRVHDNWALLYAQELAMELKKPLAVVFCLSPGYLGATMRQYSFMMAGLKETDQELNRFNIPFFLLAGNPPEVLAAFVRERMATSVVTDFNPLHINRSWKDRFIKDCRVRVVEVDAHNIVPCRAASGKQEFGAYTLRPKISRRLQEFLTQFPAVQYHPFPWKEKSTVHWELIESSLKLEKERNPVNWIKPGEMAGREALNEFIRERLAEYHEQRNNPTLRGQSDLSPYIHFGQISAQRIALEIQESPSGFHSKAAFLEELIVRRELSDNYCLYNSHYDSFEGLPPWAQKTLNEHRSDPRQFLYSLDQFEDAETHDELWNAAQKEMVMTGKLHGFMRMYWAKKILEWTSSPEEAMTIAIYLNDKYELDGRDPNGYAGIAWSIGGVHDRAWGSRPVFGKIRYMNDKGCRRKFDVMKYIRNKPGER